MSRSSPDLPVPNSSQMGVSATVFNWNRPFMRGAKDSTIFEATNTTTNSSLYNNNVYTNINVSGIAGGFVFSNNTKAKYRFNMVDERSSKKIKKIRRVNVSSDIALEVLYAPSITFKSSTNLMASDMLQNYAISNVKVKHVGFRIRAEVRERIFSIRFEIICSAHSWTHSK